MSEQPTSSTPTPDLLHTESGFVGLDSSELNDMRRRIVSNEEVSDDELRHAIQTKLYDARQQLSGIKKPGKKTAPKKLDPSVNFDDLLNT